MERAFEHLGVLMTAVYHMRLQKKAATAIAKSEGIGKKTDDFRMLKRHLQGAMNSIEEKNELIRG